MAAPRTAQPAIANPGRTMFPALEPETGMLLGAELTVGRLFTARTVPEDAGVAVHGQDV
jgi:hypothetical protein